ncbi:unnamed protein product [Ceutorhynchus assimilis]|uniref:Elongation of very long chain fatty acids protein n=1 Tax=Ceutorhynchus assimilis TaxID=467358 RepID=A0A9P0DKC8_9CUCU|nr:unnamed protein product [Ceutorhynchus assimilis]
MALLLKRGYETYFYCIQELADPRAEEYFMLRSPIPTLIILFFWFKFVFKWGPDYMKDRKPMELKKVMMVYNVIQVFINGMIVYYTFRSKHLVNFKCMPIDYSDSYWGQKFLYLSHMYYLLKIADLLDTVFFILRKKSGHVSFLHTYHHFMMVLAGWVGAKFLPGGHSYFLGLANCTVHTILYSYYLLTAYDSKYSKLLWLKKFITQAQLLQFVFLLFAFGSLLFSTDCSYPKGINLFFVPQNTFMIVLFSDFYIRNYYLEPKRRRKLAEQARFGNEQAKLENDS